MRYSKEFEGKRPYALASPDGNDLDSHSFNCISITAEELAEVAADAQMVLVKDDEDSPFHILDMCEWMNIPCGIKDVAEHHIIYRTKAGATADECMAMLACMRNGVKREQILTDVAKIIKVAKGTLKAEVNKMIAEREKAMKLTSDMGENSNLILPPHVDRDEFMEWGFYEDETPGSCGYYFATAGGGTEQVSNFIMRPLFHVYDAEDNKRLAEIDNGRHRKVIEVPSKAFISLEQFQTLVFEQGFFTFDGSKTHLAKIKRRIGDQFPVCYELKSLGWQSEGFFAYNNCIYGDKLEWMDVNGIVEFGDRRFYSPSSSEVFSGYREEDDQFENDRYLTFIKTEINFGSWARMMAKAYGDKKAALAIAFVGISLFKDIVFSVDNSCPNLYAYGQVQSGKSKYGESISALFFNSLPAFNLNQGTDFAFFARLSRYRNCPMLFNEFDEEAIKEEWFRALKAIYDGEGRERGRGGKRNKTETQKINCTAVLMGQVLSTKDDGSVLSRCIIVPFEQTNERSSEQVAAFNTLKDAEREGLTGILTELLAKRKSFKEKYAALFDKNLKQLKAEVKKEGRGFKERIARNYTAALTSYTILNEHFSLPFSVDFMSKLCRDEIIRLSELIAENNALAEFWNTVNFLFETGELEEDRHFKIERALQVNIDNGRGQAEVKSLGTGKKVLYMRLGIVHQLYAQECARQRKRAMNQASIRLYMESEPGYIGNCYNTRFSGVSTSAVMFDYDLLPMLNLERFDNTGEECEITGVIEYEPELVDMGNGAVMKIRLTDDQSYTSEDGRWVTKKVSTTCYITPGEKMEALSKGMKLVATGPLTVKDFKGNVIRSMKVNTYKIDEGTGNHTEDLPY